MKRKFQLGNPGKPKGAKSKFTTLKVAFLSVFQKLGGEEELLNWVKSTQHNKAMFYQWITKMLPADIEMKQSGEVQHTGKMIIEVVHTKP